MIIQRILTKSSPLLDCITATESWTQLNFPREKGKESGRGDLQKFRKPAKLSNLPFALRMVSAQVSQIPGDPPAVISLQ